MSNLLVLLATPVISMVASGALVWLCREWISNRLKMAIQHEYNVKLESYKNQLSASADLQLETHKATLQVQNAGTTERLKADLQGSLAERQIRYGRMQEKIADAVSQIYLRLSDLVIAAERYTTPFEWDLTGTKSDRRLAFAKALGEFEDHYKRHKLYLSKSLAGKIKKFVEKLNGIAIDFMTGIEYNGNLHSEDPKSWPKIHAEMQTGTKSLFEGLEDEFRGLLGVPNDPAPEVSRSPTAAPHPGHADPVA